MIDLPRETLGVLKKGVDRFLAVAYVLADEKLGASVWVRDIAREWPTHLFGSGYSPAFYTQARNEKWIVPSRSSRGLFVLTVAGVEYLNALVGVAQPIPAKGGRGFIDIERLKELRAIQSEEYDLTRLIRMCEELDDSFDRGNYIASILLVRSILDHCAPIFGRPTFEEVVNNEKLEKSTKESFCNLQNSSRKIADGHLHIAIRKKETVPTKTQVNFSHDLDVLLGEIVRRLKS